MRSINDVLAWNSDRYPIERSNKRYFQSLYVQISPRKQLLCCGANSKELKIWRPGNTTNLISWLKICRNFQYIVDGPHRTLEEERLIVIVIIKAPFLATFILKIIAYDFSTYHSPTFKSCSGLGATISF